MKHCFQIEIHACVNFSTKAAEVYITDETYNGRDGIVVRQKHISSHNTVEEAEQAAEAYCKDLALGLREMARMALSTLPNAKP